MLVKMIIRAIFAFILTLSLFLAGNFVSADTLDLGSLSGQAANGKFQNNVTLTVGNASYALSPDEMKTFISQKESLAFNKAYRSEIENTRPCVLKKNFICDLLFSAGKAEHIQKVSQAYLDTGAMAGYLDGLAGKTDRDPQDARLQTDGGQVSVFSLSQDGIKLDKEKSLQILGDYFKNSSASGSVALAYNIIKPDISTDSIDNLGITSLIGEGTSNFGNSPKNRIHNLTLGAQKLNGVLIKPGEEFSFLKTLGPVDESTGYLPELSIVGNQTELEFGGGMCQVSTTAFRAAIYSGLKITSRTPHAYPVSYYNPQGMDATVYIPAPDLKFINNTPGYILIQTKIVGTILTFDFYGTDDGRKTTVIGPTITERNPDGSMKANFTQQVVDKNGTPLLSEIFNSNYNSPYKYPHPGAAPLTVKPANWSKDEWKQYKKNNPA